ncbi:MAG: pilus assembly protein N-terminal domain-containing protein, partial [Nitratireductor sp.]
MASTSKLPARQVLIGALAALSLAAGAAPALAEAGIRILMNEAKIVKLTRPADTIVVGNPQIADASVQDATTLVLTGRGFGVTNIVVLDLDGAPIVDEQIYVARQDNKSVR